MTNLQQIMAMEDSILKWILWAWAIEYAAVVNWLNDEYIVVNIYKSRIDLRGKDGSITHIFKDEIRKKVYYPFEITGYLYGAQLCGSEKIPDGQRFKIKKTGEIVYYKSVSRNGLDEECLMIEKYENGIPKNRPIYFKKSEISPIFIN